ncbi:ABC transporter permease [Streptomyces sp. RTd22]|uniref:ABC transporter permease n=1 Tax=Streptomyces sp. RTd22 TaxID=1841249 RepID=UPI000B1EA400|nr:ABC transporter permease [Streptomyces sp. RTd22]
MTTAPATTDRPAGTRTARPGAVARRRIATRVATGLGVMWAAATVAYVVLHSMPGKIEDILLGDQTYPGAQEAVAAEWGLDRPPLVQYLDYLGRLLHGDLGTSYAMRQPVAAIVGDQLWPTAQLTLLSAALALILALSVAIATAGRARPLRAVASLAELVATSTPVYWLGILLLMVFSFELGWFPVTADRGAASLVLPAVTLGLPMAGLLSQVLREALESTLEQPFITTVRARGVGETLVRLRHALAHALPPVINLGGWMIGNLLGGAVITETVFGRPGLGAVTLTAVTNKDVPVVLAVVLLAAFAYVVISTLVDIVNLLIDPRLRTR